MTLTVRIFGWIFFVLSYFWLFARKKSIELWLSWSFCDEMLELFLTSEWFRFCTFGTKEKIIWGSRNRIWPREWKPRDTFLHARWQIPRKQVEWQTRTARTWREFSSINHFRVMNVKFRFMFFSNVYEHQGIWGTLGQESRLWLTVKQVLIKKAFRRMGVTNSAT